jgi:hypothetical protein
MTRIMFIMFCFLMSTACRLPQIAFRQQDVDVCLMKHMVELAGGYRNLTLPDSLKRAGIEKDKMISGLRLYGCVLEDAYMIRNHLVEETIRNVDASNTDGPEPLQGNEYRLYLAVTGSTAGELAVFLPSVFDASERCLRLGPAWMGTWGAGEFRFYKTLQHLPDRSGGPGRWFYDRKENEYRKKHSKTPSGKSSDLLRHSLRFVTDRTTNINKLDSFRIIRIFRRSPSQIGADKGVLFDLPEILRDSAALRFVRVDSVPVVIQKRSFVEGEMNIRAGGDLR